MSKDTFKEVVEKVWPKTKRELEKALKNTKTMIDKGEEYLKDVSEKSVKNTKKLSINIKKEKLFYDLGKQLSSLPKTKWASSQKASKIVNSLKALDKDIKKLK